MRPGRWWVWQGGLLWTVPRPPPECGVGHPEGLVALLFRVLLCLRARGLLTTFPPPSWADSPAASAYEAWSHGSCRSVRPAIPGPEFPQPQPPLSPRSFAGPPFPPLALPVVLGTESLYQGIYFLLKTATVECFLDRIPNGQESPEFSQRAHFAVGTSRSARWSGIRVEAGGTGLISSQTLPPGKGGRPLPGGEAGPTPAPPRPAPPQSRVTRTRGRPGWLGFSAPYGYEVSVGSSPPHDAPAWTTPASAYLPREETQAQTRKSGAQLSGTAALGRSVP